MSVGTVRIEGFEEADRLLAKIADPAERNKAFTAGLRAAGNVVKTRAKELVPKPGYPGDKPGLKPLRDTLSVLVKQYSDVWVAVVGPSRPAGRHGHLVEYGHRLVKGGTSSKRSDRTPGLTAAGRRWVESQGFRSRSGSQYWYDEAGNKHRIGMQLRGINSIGNSVVVTVRGLGRVIGHVAGRAFMTPAARDTAARQQSIVIETINKLVS
jgi:hypothetical protein